MANKKTKEKKLSRKSGSSLFKVKNLAAIASDENLSQLSGNSEQNEDEDFVGDGPSMEDILVSLEGLLDNDDGKSFVESLVVDQERSKKKPVKKFVLTSLKGFESDANLEQELMDTLEMSTYEFDISLDQEDDISLDQEDDIFPDQEDDIFLDYEDEFWRRFLDRVFGDARKDAVDLEFGLRVQVRGAI